MKYIILYKKSRSSDWGIHSESDNIKEAKRLFDIARDYDCVDRSVKLITAETIKFSGDADDFKPRGRG